MSGKEKKGEIVERAIKRAGYLLAADGHLKLYIFLLAFRYPFVQVDDFLFFTDPGVHLFNIIPEFPAQDERIRKCIQHDTA